MKELTLFTCPRWQDMKVVKVVGSHKLQQHLLALGFYPGVICHVFDRLDNVRLIQLSTNKYALSEDAANCVLVTPA